MNRKKKKKTGAVPGRKIIIVNKKARHDFFIDETYEAGLALEGWEVKLFGAHISPLASASTHVKPDPVRTRKLLLHRRQIDNLIGLVERKGYTLVPLCLYWSKGRAKLEIGLARGKKRFDKRAAEKDRDWQRQKERILKGQ
jgi:SsrA-binding protein